MEIGQYIYGENGSAIPAQDRRSHPRLHRPYPVVVRGIDIIGDDFEENTHIDNVSAGGLGLTIAHRVSPGSKLFVVFHLSTDGTAAPLVAARGTVRRVEFTLSSYADRVGIEIRHHRFLANRPRSYMMPNHHGHNGHDGHSSYGSHDRLSEMEASAALHAGIYLPATFQTGSTQASSIIAPATDWEFNHNRGIAGGDL
jgi:hypothetical protein